MTMDEEGAQKHPEQGANCVCGGSRHQDADGVNQTSDDQKAVRPSWQTSVCPPWCEIEHLEEHMGGDRDHQTYGVAVPVIRVIRTFGKDVPAGPDGTDASDGSGGRTSVRRLTADYVEIGVYQAQDELRPTVAIGIGDEAAVSIELKEESAERLVEEIVRVLAFLDGLTTTATIGSCRRTLYPNTGRVDDLW